MGLFSNVSGFVEKKLKQREEQGREEKEIREIEHKHIMEERKRQAPVFAAAKVKIEMGHKLAAAKQAPVKSGGMFGGIGNLQNIAHGMGKSTGNAFTNDFNTMMGSRRPEESRRHERKETKKQEYREHKKPKTVFESDYEKYFGRS
jgi:hypothetical protein